MKIAPNFEVTQFEKLEIGDLFIYDFEGGASAGIKVVGPNQSGDLMGALLLGPNFPGTQIGPHLVAAPKKSVLSFGKDFTIQFPIAPAFWAINEPPLDNAWMVLDDTKRVFFRVPYEDKGDCFVDVNTGNITNVPSSDTFAYPKSWKIVIALDSGETHVLVQQN